MEDVRFGLVDTGEVTLKTRQKYLWGYYSPAIYRIRDMTVSGSNGNGELLLYCKYEWFVVADFERVLREVDMWLEWAVNAGEQPYCYVVHELPQFVSIPKGGHLREWLLYGDMVMSESLCCNWAGEEKFMGRPAEKLLFAPGDAVEVVFDDRVVRGVVVSTPPSDTEVVQIFARHREQIVAENPAATEWETFEWKVYSSFPMEYDMDSYEVLLEGCSTPQRVPCSRVVKGRIVW